MFVHLKQQLMDKFTVDYEMNLLNDKIGELEPKPYHETVNFLVAHPGSKGGMVMYNKDKFIKCKGYNPNFVAWGFEDDEIINRVKRLGYEWDRVKDTEAIAWHFPHENTVREKHSMYQNNYNHSEFVGHCSDTELQEYIKKWKV
jgi:predicted glycosyltransferase involved in capsule biosynthesis